jgi:hypothetical protein
LSHIETVEQKTKEHNPHDRLREGEGQHHWTPHCFHPGAAANRADDSQGVHH